MKKELNDKEKQVIEYISYDYFYNTKIGYDPFDNFNPAIVAMEVSELVSDNVSENYVLYIFNQLKNNPDVADYIKYEIPFIDALKYFSKNLATTA